MGAWGSGSFENDDAADFLSDLMDGKDLAPVRDVLQTVLKVGGYLEAQDASQAIAAAEVLAAAAGRPTVAAQRKSKLCEWLARYQPPVDPRLLANAVQALDRIVGEGSELKELWEDAGTASEWIEAVETVRSKLEG